MMIRSKAPQVVSQPAKDYGEYVDERNPWPGDFESDDEEYVNKEDLPGEIDSEEREVDYENPHGLPGVTETEQEDYVLPVDVEPVETNDDMYDTADEFRQKSIHRKFHKQETTRKIHPLPDAKVVANSRQPPQKPRQLSSYEIDQVGVPRSSSPDVQEPIYTNTEDCILGSTPNQPIEEAPPPPLPASRLIRNAPPVPAVPTAPRPSLVTPCPEVPRVPSILRPSLVPPTPKAQSASTIQKPALPPPSPNSPSLSILSSSTVQRPSFVPPSSNSPSLNTLRPSLVPPTPKAQSASTIQIPSFVPPSPTSPSLAVRSHQVEKSRTLPTSLPTPTIQSPSFVPPSPTSPSLAARSHQIKKSPTLPTFPPHPTCSGMVRKAGTSQPDLNSLVPESVSKPTSPSVLSKRSPKKMALESQVWYVGDCGPAEVDELLKKASEDGTFLVRNSQRSGQPYTLCVLHQGDLRRFPVRNRKEDGNFALGTPKPDETVFSSVAEMIAFYRNNPIEYGKERSKVTLRKAATE